jgi:hypothetical protein
MAVIFRGLRSQSLGSEWNWGTYGTGGNLAASWGTGVVMMCFQAPLQRDARSPCKVARQDGRWRMVGCEPRSDRTCSPALRSR